MVDKSKAEAGELSSPACMASQADDVYMGFAGKPELAAFLNELLEAERAGAAVTLKTAQEATDDSVVALMRAVHADEAKWCAMLLRQLRALDAPASPNIGAFLDKAMAISELGERIAFINRGQGWVVRKLKEMLPRVRGDALHADLKEMLVSHEENIARVNERGKSA